MPVLKKSSSKGNSPLTSRPQQPQQMAAAPSSTSSTISMRSTSSTLSTISSVSTQPRSYVSSSSTQSRSTRQPSQFASQHPTSILYEEVTTFSNVMARCGVKLSNSTQVPTELNTIQANVVAALNKTYEGSTNKEAFLELFLRGFEKYLRTPVRLQLAVQHSMSPAPKDDEDEEEEQRINSESLVRILLMVDVLQKGVAEILLTKLTAVIESMKSTEAAAVTKRMKPGDLPKLLIDQFRHLENVNHGEDICVRFIDILQLCDHSLKSYILSALSQLTMNNEVAERIAEKLEDTVKVDPSIISDVMLCLGQLPLSAETLRSHRDRLLDQFAMYSPTDKIAAFKFLLVTAEAAGELKELFVGLRDIEFQSFDSVAGQSQQGTATQTRMRPDCTTTMALSITSIIEEAFKQSIALADTARQVEVEACGQMGKDKGISVFITMILHKVRNPRSILNLIRQKFRNKRWDPKLLDACFSHPEALDQFFDDLMAIADYLIRETDKSLNSIGAIIYQRAYQTMNKTRKGQVVSFLVGHVNEGNESLANVALAVLNQLCASPDMLEFDVILRGLLEMLVGLKLHQTRTIFGLFGQLALADNCAMRSMDELRVFVRKNLHSGSLSSRTIGLLAALALYRNLIKEKDAETEADSLYDAAYKGSSENPTLRSLFYDEISCIIRDGAPLNDQFLARIKAMLFEKLEAYVSKVDQKVWKRLVTDGALMGASSDDDPKPALKLLNGNAEKDSEMDSSAIALPSLIRLLLNCEWRLVGNFDDMDLLLQSPIILQKRSNWTKIAAIEPIEQEATIMELLQSANVLIELVNGLSRIESNGNTTQIIIQRLSDLVSVRREFDTSLPGVPTFEIPDIEPDSKESRGRTRKAPTPGEGTTSKKRKVTKKKSKTAAGSASTQKTCTDIISQMASARPGNQSFAAGDSEEPGTSHKESTAKSNAKSNQKYWREFDPVVYRILECPVTFKDGEEQNNGNAIDASSLAFLLSNLVEKLNDLTVTQTKAKWGNFAKKTSKSSLWALDTEGTEILKNHLKTVMPHVWKHLISALTYFKDTAEENDGIIDSWATRNAKSENISKCVEMSVTAVTNYLKLLDEEDDTRGVLKDALASFGDGSADMDLEDLFNPLVDRLLEFADSIPTITLAVSLLRGANVMARLACSRGQEFEIAKIADGYLKREWSFDDANIASNMNASVAALLDISLFFRSSTEKMEKILAHVLMYAAFTRKDGSEELDYKCLSKGTLVAWYRTLFANVVDVTRNAPKFQKDGEAWLKFWVEVGKAFRLMAKIVNVSSTRQILVAALQNGGSIVRLFTTDAVETLEKAFKDIYPNNFQNLLRIFQHGTRALHDICVHARINTDKVVSKHIPPVKRSLELFIYRVESFVKANKCESAFTIGLLKNKDLAGHMVASQAPSQNSSVSIDDDNEEEAQASDQENQEIEEPTDDDAVPNDEDDDDGENSDGENDDASSDGFVSAETGDSDSVAGSETY